MPVCLPQARRWRCHIKDQTNKQTKHRRYERGVKAKNTNEIQVQIQIKSKCKCTNDSLMGIMRRGRARPISDSGNRGPSLSLVPTIIILSFQLDLRNSNDNHQVKDKCKIRRHQIQKLKKQTQHSDNFLSSSKFHSFVSI